MTEKLCEISAEDYTAVYELWQHCDGLGGLENREQFVRFVDRNPGLSVTVRDDKIIVGALMCGHDGRRGYLYHLAVHPDARGRGLARLMIDSCLAKLNDLQIQRCTVFVKKDNIRGLEFWLHNGWWKRSDLDACAFDLVIN